MTMRYRSLRHLDSAQDFSIGGWLPLSSARGTTFWPHFLGAKSFVACWLTFWPMSWSDRVSWTSAFSCSDGLSWVTFWPCAPYWPYEPAKRPRKPRSKRRPRSHDHQGMTGGRGYRQHHLRPNRHTERLTWTELGAPDLVFLAGERRPSQRAERSANAHFRPLPEDFGCAI